MKKKLDPISFLVILAFILFWTGYYIGYTQYKRNIESKTVKAEIRGVNTSEYELGDTLYIPQDTIYLLNVTIPADTNYKYYRIQAVGTGKREYIFGYYVDSVTQRQITIEY
jgi:hypothetical protein